MKRRDKPIRYEDHAEERIHERGIDKSQVEATVRDPDGTRPAKRPGATRFEKRFRKRRLAIIAIEGRYSIRIVSGIWISR